MRAPDRATPVSPRPPRGKAVCVSRVGGISRSGTTRRVALVAALVLSLLAGAVVVAAAAASAWRSPDSAALPTALTVLASAGAAALLVGLAGSIAAEAVAQLARPGRHHRGDSARRPGPAAPRFVQRLVAGLLGVAAVTSTGVTSVGGAAGAVEPVPVGAESLDPSWTADEALPAALPAVTSDHLDPGWTPAVPAPEPRSIASADLVSAAPREASTPDLDEVVVRRGDTLWDLAARTLPGTATDAEIAVEWPRWYAANADIVGPDPDLLLPGQRLRVPAGQVQR